MCVQPALFEPCGRAGTQRWGARGCGLLARRGAVGLDPPVLTSYSEPRPTYRQGTAIAPNTLLGGRWMSAEEIVGPPFSVDRLFIDMSVRF